MFTDITAELISCTLFCLPGSVSPEEETSRRKAMVRGQFVQRITEEDRIRAEKEDRKSRVS